MALAGGEKTDHSEIYSESSPSWKAVRKKDCGLKGILPLQSLLPSECLLRGWGGGREWEKEALYIPKTTFQNNGSQVLEKDISKNYIFTVVRHF